jgi:hypothetical protein
MTPMKIEKIKIVRIPGRELKGKWNLEPYTPTHGEQEEINKECGVGPCKICGSYLHGWEIHHL